ncbi:type II 3-dehydroquinate dehydratase [uncultured Moraxella sp.]|uniref:type II 3-dehydroquinate dehydratase n=1 Tax=uncultured Moraxella sp. TaxID=263769 RepID=UPI0025E6D5F9|nr:type II 3-dehydroquinate dehydratase [uncultured Moraxella sp.]
MSTKKIALINGPNLHLLGKREPHIYGATTLQDIEVHLSNLASRAGIELICFQSNHEGAIVDFVSDIGLLSDTPVDGVIINPAAFTHTSVAIRDALSALNKPFIEVHLSNVHAREPFRAHSYFSDKAVGVICGLGDIGYEMALNWFVKYFSTHE